MDLYTTNNDFSGERTLDQNEEIVEYHQNSLHRVWFNEQTASYEAHWHTAMEIIVPIENYYDIVINGVNYHINPGDIFIVPSGLVHKIISPNYGKRYVFLMEITPLTSLEGYSAIAPVMSSPITINKAENPKVYEDLYQTLVKIRNIYFSDNQFSELRIHSLITEFLIVLAENHANQGVLFENTRLYKQKEYSQKFNAVLEYMDKHYNEPIELEDMAELSGFSKFHFSRLFKQYTDMTFCDYINYRRIKVAESLLASPDLSITEVSMQAGFPSISTFNRVFKQKHGCTPTEYRMRNSRHFSFVKKNEDVEEEEKRNKLMRG